MTQPHTIPIHIDKQKYLVPEGAMSGAEIRSIPPTPIADRYDLFLEVPGGEDELIEDGRTVDLRPGMHFFSAPRVISPGL